MKKIIYIFLILLLSAFALCGCQNNTEQNNNAEQNDNENDNDGYTFTDDLGRTVTVSSYEKTAALLGSYADIWMLAGGSVCATADDAWNDFNLDLPENTVNLGGTKNLSLEKLFSADPDFIIASTNTPQHVEWQKNFEDAGITAAYFDVSDFSDYLRVLKICTDITGNSKAYETYGTKLETQINEILERNKGQASQSVLVIRASASDFHVKNSSGTILGSMLKDFGCINIADNDSSLLENLSIESIAVQNPDKIFFIEVGDDTEGAKENIEHLFADNPLWSELDAVKNKNVYHMDKHLYNFKPNARWAEAYENLEEILYAN